MLDGHILPWVIPGFSEVTGLLTRKLKHTLNDHQNYPQALRASNITHTLTQQHPTNVVD